MSKKAKIRVKTPVGTSEEKDIEDIVMQGESISSIMCSTSIDKMARDCPLEPHKYKNAVDIPQMSFVDDVIDINKCGKKTQEMNTYTVNEVSKRRLQLSEDKCVRMHINSKRSSAKNKCKAVYIDAWK